MVLFNLFNLFNLFGLCTEPKTDISQCKNVIFLIGDGMGFNSIEKTKFDCNVTLDGFDAFTVRGESKTRSSSSLVTDSAAGGTALATAQKTTNGGIGVYPYDMLNVVSHPMNLTELAISQGKLAGVITTDKTSGATPASFSAHTRNRGDEEKITSQQLSGELTLCWGAETESFTVESAESNGFTTITDKASMDALEEGGRSFGQFTEDVWHNYENNGMPTLTQMTEKAIDLLDDDEDGFFLMVEAAHIDKNSHNNNGEGMTDALQSFDKTLSYVLDYAEKDGNTLVVVTADHETGGITFKNGEYKYTTTNHTGVNVPLLVYGCDDFMENGEVMENTEVSRRVACAMGEKDFPIKVKN
ncbi:MAG: alkaline phosphatase [Acutalibacteraceae bacterium]